MSVLCTGEGTQARFTEMNSSIEYGPKSGSERTPPQRTVVGRAGLMKWLCLGMHRSRSKIVSVRMGTAREKNSQTEKATGSKEGKASRFEVRGP